MKTKLIKINGIYTLLGEDNKMIASDDIDFQSDYKIGKLSKQNCKVIENGYDLDELSKECVINDENISPEIKRWLIIAFKLGFQKCDEMNSNKVFTIEDVGNLWDFCTYNKGSFYEGLESLQQPTEIEVEIEYMFSVEENGESTNTGITKLDDNGCLILKRI